MKKISKILSIVLALVMVMSLTVFVSAEETTTYTKITSMDELTTGQYVVICSNGVGLGKLDGTWVLTASPVVDGDTVTDAAGAVWTLTVDGTNVKLADANGKYIAPKGGNNNGVKEGEYDWTVSCADGMFSFAGQGSDTVTLAGNADSENKFRGYKNTTVSGQYASKYPSTFALYKLDEAEPDPEPTPDPEGLIAVLKFMDADYSPFSVDSCPTPITGAGTYTMKLENITATFGAPLDVADMLYIEVAGGYAELKDFVVTDVQIIVDGEAIAVNQDYIWTYESLDTEFQPTGAYCIEIYNKFGYAGAGYGAAIDPAIYADESIEITFTLGTPEPTPDPNPTPDPTPDTGDMIFAVLSILAVSGMGITAVVSKKN